MIENDIRIEQQNAVDEKLADEAVHVDALKAIEHDAEVKKNAENARYASQKAARSAARAESDKKPDQKSDAILTPEFPKTTDDFAAPTQDDQKPVEQLP